MTWWEALSKDFAEAGNLITAKRLAEKFNYKHSNAVYALFHGELPFKLDSLRMWYELTGAKHLMRWAGSVTNHHVAPIPIERADDLQYADLMREFSEAVTAYTMATADGKVTPGEALDVCQQLDDVIVASHRLKISINKRAQQRGVVTILEAEQAG